MGVAQFLKSVVRLPLERVYEGRLAAKVHSLPRPRHVGVILDGNRRWAAEQGGPASRGHRIGGSRIVELLNWCGEDGVEVVTLWMLSTENFSRAESELIPLLRIIERTASELAETRKWRLKVVGAKELLPQATREELEQAETSTADLEGMQVNLAVAYGGRFEVVDAVRSYLRQCAETGSSIEQCADGLTEEHISSHLYTKGQPDPDLVIRTSGEQRLSGFLLWQSAHSEYWFCEAYWPDFRRIDFLRALRDFGLRKRRYGA